MNLLILTAEDRISDGKYRIEGDRARHIREILKSTAGEELRAGLLNGPQGVARIVVVETGHVEVSFEPFPTNDITPSDEVTVDLICALPRPQTVKKILISAGTWGIRRLDFVRAKRVERSFYHSPLLTSENMRPFLIEGLSQGKQTRLPEVSIHERFKAFFEDVLPSRQIPENAVKILPHPGSQSHLYDVLKPEADHIQLAIGPEGGWIDFELEFMQSHGFCLATLGQPTLRVETATVAALAQIELILSKKKPG